MAACSSLPASSMSRVVGVLLICNTTEFHRSEGPGRAILFFNSLSHHLDSPLPFVFSVANHSDHIKAADIIPFSTSHHLELTNRRRSSMLIQTMSLKGRVTR